MQNIISGPEVTWPKEFVELKLIDDALRCGICYDYITTCMVTPCAHSYCSICIRRSLHYKAACPTCFEETFETNLRNNRVLDRVCELYVSIRDKLLKHLRIAAVHFNCKEQLQSPTPTQSLFPLKSQTSLSDATPKRNQKPVKAPSTKGKINFTASPKTIISQKSVISKRLEDILGSPGDHPSSSNEKLESSLFLNENDLNRMPTVPPMFLQTKMESVPKTDIPTVPCPVCSVDIPERNINTHLDNCLANVDKCPVKSPVKTKHKRNPLPKMVWSMMAEKDLRKKLKDYGLNTQGDKKTLISRLQRYIILFNSECDKDNPRPISEIIRQVEREEKQGSSQIQPRLVINSKSDPKLIEEENKKYIQENKNCFKKLIEAMREREGKNIKPVATCSSNRIVSDDENDLNLTDRDEPSESSKQTKEMRKSILADRSINLCGSDDEEEGSSSASPILDAWSTPYKKTNAFVTKFSENVPSVNNVIPDEMSVNNENSCESNSILEELPKNNNPPVAELDDNFCNGSPSGSLSRSCIISACSSDSEDSFSILNNYNNADEISQDMYTEPVTENVPECNSQLEDPDFVADTELCESEANSEEMFIPQRKSKRKQHSLAVSENPSVSPRRSRRRLNK